MVPCPRCRTIPLVALSLVVAAPIGAFAQDRPGPRVRTTPA